MKALSSIAFGIAACVLIAPSFAAAQRPVTLDDYYKLREVDDPQISPDANWVAYTVQTVNAGEDKHITHIWMTRFDGAQTVQLTSRPKETESKPRFSPDGRFISFLSERADDKHKDQLWLMSRAGGEAQKLSDFKGGITDYAWSPDGKRLAIVASDPNPEDDDSKDKKDKTKKPIVIDRFTFMEDVTGYLRHFRDHLYVMDVASKKVDQITSGDFDDALPAWSPDSKSLVFASKRVKNADRSPDWNLFVVAAQKGANPRQLTTFTGEDNMPNRFDTGSYPAWSPDGKWIAYWQGGDPKLIEYATNKLAIISASGGAAKILTPTLDRNIGNVSWSDDSKSVLLSVEDDRTEYLARVPVEGGKIEHIAGGRNVIGAYAQKRGRFALLISTPTQPEDVFAWDGKSAPRQISHQNDWLKEVKLAPTEEIAFKSKDGTDVHGFLLKPTNGASARLPTILRIHGGPQSQFADAFSFEWQLLAAHGYAVVAANPRGSTGRGQKYCAGIYANWGGPDVQDELAAVDYAVKAGVADPNRLGVGGWSYGGMLTNYVIATDTRFKAATSGASISDILGGYGNDQYSYDYETELGVPWKNTATWMKVSFPFLHADRIKTPTLFLGGDEDMNVPLHNGEQMYQALKSMGIDTQLVIYPGQYHGLTTPSYLRDREQRYLDWYDKHLKAAAAIRS
jgi:dipeptidyl aminopeptidase/acylaminoacyl peptidase